MSCCVGLLELTMRTIACTTYMTYTTREVAHTVQLLPYIIIGLLKKSQILFKTEK